jgi:SAM-dependent methyltransferase
MDEGVNADTREWDYDALAAHYRLRAPYDAAALDALFARLAPDARADCVDVGAGSGRLTAELVARGLRVTAIEPSAPMRAIGARDVPGARWIEADAQHCALEDACCSVLTFGSSFNVMPAQVALDLAARLLRPRGALVVLWNHRDLDDPLQQRLQEAIEEHVPGYAHGSRRDDPTATIGADGRFEAAAHIRGRFSHRVRAVDFVEGFRAHATLVRQAGEAMPRVLDAMHRALAGHEVVDVPFTTRIWFARRRAGP